MDPASAGTAAGLDDAGPDARGTFPLRVDLTDEAGLAEAFAAVVVRFGRARGVFVAAGPPIDAAMGMLGDVDHQAFAQQLRTRGPGLDNLARLAADHVDDFVVVTSSLAATLGGLGIGTYAFAHGWADALVSGRLARSGGVRWISIEWDRWSGDDDRHHSSRDSTIDASVAIPLLLDIVGTDGQGVFAVSKDDITQRLRQTESHEHLVGTAQPVPGPSRSDMHPRPEIGIAYIEPSTELTRYLADTWSELLGIAPIGIDDGFFDLGGDSLIAMQLMTKLRDRHNVELPLTALFEDATIRALAVFLEAAVGDAPAPTGPAPAAVDHDDVGTAELTSEVDPALLLELLEEVESLSDKDLASKLDALRLSGDAQ